MYRIGMGCLSDVRDDGESTADQRQDLFDLEIDQAHIKVLDVHITSAH